MKLTSFKVIKPVSYTHLDVYKRQQSLRMELLSLIYKRLAICTFLLGWVHFMSSDLDGVKGAVILGLCIVSTILDGTFDALVFSVYFHGKASF